MVMRCIWLVQSIEIAKGIQPFHLPRSNLSGPDSGASPCKPSAAHLDSLREDSVRQSATRERNPHDVLSTLPRDEWVRTWRCIVDHCWQKKGCLREH